MLDLLQRVLTTIRETPSQTTLENPWVANIAYYLEQVVATEGLLFLEVAVIGELITILVNAINSLPQPSPPPDPPVGPVNPPIPPNTIPFKLAFERPEISPHKPEPEWTPVTDGWPCSDLPSKGTLESIEHNMTYTLEAVMQNLARAEDPDEIHQLKIQSWSAYFNALTARTMESRKEIHRRGVKTVPPPQQPCSFAAQKP